MIRFTPVIFEMRIKVIGKEKYSQHNEHDKKFYQCYNPQGFTDSHAVKSITIKPN